MSIENTNLSRIEYLTGEYNKTLKKELIRKKEWDEKSKHILSDLTIISQKFKIINRNWIPIKTDDLVILTIPTITIEDNIQKEGGNLVYKKLYNGLISVIIKLPALKRDDKYFSSSDNIILGNFEPNQIDSNSINLNIIKFIEEIDKWEKEIK